MGGDTRVTSARKGGFLERGLYGRIGIRSQKETVDAVLGTARPGLIGPGPGAITSPPTGISM